MSDLRLPWAYRPREFDDWGFIRDATGNLAAIARGDNGVRSHDGHRAAGTDPYGEYAAVIVEAVNDHRYLSIMHQRFVAYLAARYNDGEAVEIARWCDETLDRSGRLLGEVRDVARSDPLRGDVGSPRP